MSICQLVINNIVSTVIENNQSQWFLNLRSLGGFINNLENPKLKALHNFVSPEISKGSFAICCYQAETIIRDKLVFDIESLDII